MNNSEPPERHQEQPDLFELLRKQEPATAVPEPVEISESPVADLPNAETAPEPEQKAQGEMPPEARRALVALLRNGVVMAAGKRLLFDAICRHQKKIQSHLADMYLIMLLDEQAGLAILLQQHDTETQDEEDISSLISRRTLTLYDTLLLLVLRKHYQEREAAGEQRVIIDSERVEIALRPFLPLTNSSRSDRRQLNGALKNMKERRILTAVRGEEDRFEITPVIRYVVNAAFLEKMLEEYQQLADQAEMTTSSGAGDE